MPATVRATELQDENRPDYKRKELRAVEPELLLMDDLLAGTRRMQEMALKRGYVPKWKNEEDHVYEIRRKAEVLYESFEATLSAAVGMLYAQPPKIEPNALGSRFEEHWESIDGQGTKGHVFTRQFSEQAGRDGVGVILIDHTPQPDGVTVHGGNTDALGLRPHWSIYPRASVLSWRHEERRGRQVLTQLVLEEVVDKEKGAYGSTTAERYRVLRLGPAGATWELLEKRTDAGGTSFPTLAEGEFRNARGEPAPFLPVAVAYTGRKEAELVARPPLLGVAWLNLSHWRKATNLAFYEELCAFPFPLLKGQLAPSDDELGEPQAIKLGPLSVVHVVGEESDFELRELTGSSLTQLKRSIDAKERHMGQLGMTFLAPDPNQQETATARRIDLTAQTADLATMAQGVDDAINLAMKIHAWYEGVDVSAAPTHEINRDFQSTVMDPETMRVYLEAATNEVITERMMLEAWQRGGRIPEDADLDQLLMEIMVGFEARRRNAAEDREDALREALEETGAANGSGA